MSRSLGIHFYFNDEFATALIPAFGESTCAEIRQHWRDFSKDTSSFQFTIDAVDGPALPEDGVIEELYPSRQALIVYVQRSVQKKSVRIFDTQLEPIVVNLLPQDTTQSLTERIKILFSIEEGRVARLLRDGRVLVAAVAPHTQLVDCSLIELDLQCQFLACCLEPLTFQPELYDVFDRLVVNADLSHLGGCEGVGGSDDPMALPAYLKGPERRTLRLFASEQARALTVTGEWRASSLSGKRIPSNEAVCTLVTVEALLSGASTGIILERRMKLYVWEKLQGRSRTVTAWPTDKLGDFRTSTYDSVLVDGDTLDPEQTLWEAGLQERCHLCVTRLIPLRVLDKNGVEHSVTADLGETLTTLLERLGFPESKFELWGDDKLVTGRGRSLLDLKIECFCVLKVLPTQRPHLCFNFRRAPGFVPPNNF